VIDRAVIAGQGAAGHRAALLLLAAAVMVAAVAPCWPVDEVLAAPAPAPVAAIAAAAAPSDAAAATSPTAASAPASPAEVRTADEVLDRPAPLGDLVVAAETAASAAHGVPLALTWTTSALATEVVLERTTNDCATALFPRRLCTPRAANDVACIDLAFPSSGAHALQFEATIERLSVFVPDQGVLRIEVVEADGAPIGTTARGEVRVLHATPPADRRHFVELAGGRALAVEAAGLQLELKVTTGDGRRAAPVVVTGPATPGEVVPCVVRMAPRARCSARVLGRDGGPLADEAVEVWAFDGPRRLEAGRTDREGWLTFPAPVAGGRGFAGSLVFLANTKAGAVLHGALTADLQPSAGGTLGPVHLQDCVVLCAGTCFDAEGQRAPGLELIVQVERPAELRGRGPLADSLWLDLPMGAVRSGPDGSFLVLGPPQFGRRLQLRAAGKPQSGAPFVEGAQDLRFAPKRSRKGFLR